MSRRRKRGARPGKALGAAALVLALFGSWAAWPALAAGADEGDLAPPVPAAPPDTPVPAAADEGDLPVLPTGDGAAGTPADVPPVAGSGSAAELQRRLFEDPVAASALLVGKLLPLLVGLWLLLRAFLQREARLAAGGPGIPPAPAPEGPTVAADWPVAAALVLGAMLLQLVVVSALAQLSGGSTALPFQVLGVALPGVALTAVVLRLRWRAAAELPPLRLQLGRGVTTYCIAIACVVPLGLGWSALLEAFGHAAQNQAIVDQTLHPDHPADPYWVVGLGVFVAPLWEETLFRGLLYPLGRKLLGGGRAAIWTSAIFSSALFGVMHQSLTAFLPLFVLAMVLTWIVERTNSLGAAMTAHALHNATSLVPMLLLGSSGGGA